MLKHQEAKLAYRVEEAADLLSVSRAQIYRLLDAGELTSISIGRSRRITRAQLDAFIRLKEASSSQIPDVQLNPIPRSLQDLGRWRHGQ